MATLAGFPAEPAILLIETAKSLNWPLDLALAVGIAESQLDVSAVGDSGQSFGLIQIHVPAHGRDQAFWSGLDGARRSLAEMRARWMQAAAAHDASEFARLRGEERARWFSRFWPAAQGCEPPTLDKCRETVTTAAAVLADYQAQLSGGPIMPPPAAFVPVPMPSVEFAGAHAANFSVGRGGMIPEALVVHIMDGSEVAARDWFGRPPGVKPGQRGLDNRGKLIGPSSAHFGITRGGRIIGYVDPRDTAFSNGIVNAGWEGRPAAPLINANGWETINRWCLSIEHEGTPDLDPILTTEQFAASTRLAAALFAAYMLPFAAQTGCTVSRDRILRHTDFDPRDRARCPGWESALMERYIAAVKELLFPAHVDGAALTEALVGLEMTAGSVLRVAGELDAVAGAPADVRRLANELRAIANGATAVVARHRH